uniref:Uncharacterized protein n=1 Tax=Trieres chinensis TaxID=1514140 RepID=A0A7S1YT38_TRICV
MGTSDNGHPNVPSVNSARQRLWLFTITLFVFFAFSANSLRCMALLESYDEEHSLIKVLRSKRAPSPSPSRFIIFTGHNNPSQGVGNIIAGLLAAHLLALEYGRVVCVSKGWHDFWYAFRQRDYTKECKALQSGRKKYPEVRLWNYESSGVSECELHDRLGSNESVLEFNGNTYPKWRKVPPDFFDQYYEATDDLLSKIPESVGLPDVVVHLRKGDNNGDHRKGLDVKSLEALGNTLPPSSHLVTNNVQWYEYFGEKFGWSNYGWHEVVHSIKRNHHSDDRKNQILELWVDWYSILRAKEVYHTASDFSQSAIHWMNINSKIIMGVTGEGKLSLIDEAWRRDGETPRLVDRKPEELTDTHLRPCRK